MAKLLCIAQWPDEKQIHSEYPISFEMTLSAPNEQGWIELDISVYTQLLLEGERNKLLAMSGTVLKRELVRLATDLKEFIQSQDQRQSHLTFVPITPSFEMWVNRLSDEQYRAIIWLDMRGMFDGASNIAYQGVRFVTNRARLMGFIRSLEMDIGS